MSPLELEALGVIFMGVFYYVDLKDLSVPWHLLYVVSLITLSRVCWLQHGVNPLFLPPFPFFYHTFVFLPRLPFFYPDLRFFTPPSVFLPLKIIRGPGKTIKGVKTGIYPVLLGRAVSKRVGVVELSCTSVSN